jgi:ankyrin repeat protein
MNAARLLLDRGASLEAKDNNDKNTFAHIACSEQGNVVVVRLLLDQGSDDHGLCIL